MGSSVCLQCARVWMCVRGFVRLSVFVGMCTRAMHHCAWVRASARFGSYAVCKKCVYLAASCCACPCRLDHTSSHPTAPLLHPGRAQEGALTAIASVADSSADMFVKYYDAVMPLLSSILVNAQDKQVGCVFFWCRGGKAADWGSEGEHLSCIMRVVCQATGRGAQVGWTSRLAGCGGGGVESGCLCRDSGAFFGWPMGDPCCVLYC